MKTTTIKKLISYMMIFVMAILLVPIDAKEAHATANYILSGMAHIQTYGDRAADFDGQTGVLTLGTTGQGKRLESITINFTNNTGYSGNMVYRVHRQTYGWTDWVNAGQPAGTTGQAKRLEGIQIKLTGELANHYSVVYRVHAQTYGWNQGWQYNGALAGTTGEAKRLESLEVYLVERNPNEAMGVSYRVHRQTYGWESAWSVNGGVSGTTGQAKRLEGITLALTGTQYSGSIQYCTHVQSYGWQGYVSDGLMSGTNGQAKRLEAISIYLTGEVAQHYDVYYRVHAQSYGWLGWAKNGQYAGTSSKSKRLEAIQIMLRAKGSGEPSNNVNGVVSAQTYPYISQNGPEYTTEIKDVNDANDTNNNTNNSANNNTNNNANNELEEKKKEYDAKLGQYSYEIVPLLPPFNEYFYVKTDNPNPRSFCFMDKNTVYATADSTSESRIVMSNTTYADVAYEDQENRRVKGGYIFKWDNTLSDGGELILQANISSNSMVSWIDTSHKVTCEKVISPSQYLIDNCNSNSDNFFDKMTAIDNYLGHLAVYPSAGLTDISVKNPYIPYPLYTTSVYKELGLLKYSRMYKISREELLVNKLYPYVLDSLSYPNMLGVVAKKLEPSCYLKKSSNHWEISITYGGQTKVYEGAGNGDKDSINMTDVEKLFLFDDSASDYYQHATLDDVKNKFIEYKEKGAYINNEGEDMLKVINDVPAAGSWISIGMEPFLGTLDGFSNPIGFTYTYVMHDEVPSSRSYVKVPYDAWVDGRYIGEYECWEAGATLEDHPTASIVLENVTYPYWDWKTDSQGGYRTGTVRFDYNSERDRWESRAYWATELGWIVDDEATYIPPELILTREQVEALDVDRNTDKKPEHGLIFDGTAYPGTPF